MPQLHLSVKNDAAFAVVNGATVAVIIDAVVNITEVVNGAAVALISSAAVAVIDDVAVGNVAAV